jgi:thioredoxin type arsenate reductase
MPPLKVLFLCTGNSCRSQMAEGLLRNFSGGSVEAWSAGTHPKAIHPYAVRAMQEIGIDISSQRSKSLESLRELEFDWVITVCDQARQSCPVLPGALKTLHWDVRDPAAAEGSDEERITAFRSVREDLCERIRLLLLEMQGASKAL